jgi:HK97 family phage major capsid protein
MAGIDINRTTAGVSLPPAVADEIWGATSESSAAMQLAGQIPLPGAGVSVDIITGNAEAEWVAETDEKPVSRPTMGSKLMTPYTLAVIVPFSNQFRRDKARLYQALVNKLPEALALKFDRTVFGDVAAPGSNFDTLQGAAAVGIAGDTYAGLVAADQAVATGGGLLNGWAVSPQGRGLLLGAVDGFGRPLFTASPNTGGSVSQLLGQPVYMTRGVYLADADGAGTGTDAQLGFAGDWSGAAWGSVEGVQIAFSDQATLTDGGTTINLFQRNMFAVRAEIEVGFRVRDLDQFVKLTSATQA